jgi:hypothetical protein
LWSSRVAVRRPSCPYCKQYDEGKLNQSRVLQNTDKVAILWRCGREIAPSQRPISRSVRWLAKDTRGNIRDNSVIPKNGLGCCCCNAAGKIRYASVWRLIYLRKTRAVDSMVAKGETAVVAMYVYENPLCSVRGCSRQIPDALRWSHY